MKEVIWVKNLKTDLNKISNYNEELLKYLGELKKHKSKLFYKVSWSVIYQFSEALSAVVFLLESNFKNENELVTGRINNMNGIFIYCRKMIEANVILNILLNNNGELGGAYIEQVNEDESHIAYKIPGFIIDGQERTNDYSGYNWISKFFGVKIKSIDDLIDYASLVPEARAKLKVWIKECNYISHPNLYSDAKIMEFINGSFIDEFTYVFEIIMEMILVFNEMIKTIENHKLVQIYYQINLLQGSVPKLSVFNNKAYFTQIESHILTNKSFENLDKTSIPYNIRAEYSMVNVFLTSPINKDFSQRKRKTLGKLIDILAEDIREMVLGYFHNKSEIYFPKIRQVLEDVSYIDLVLDMEEEEIEAYQCYTDIQRYVNAQYTIGLFNEINGLKLDHKKIQVPWKDGTTTAEKAYSEDINFIKNYFKAKFNKIVKSSFIKRPNSWAFDGKKIPSNWGMIKNMICRIDPSLDVDVNYGSGLYSLSSIRCHVNAFNSEKFSLKANDLLSNTLIYVLKIVKNNFMKLYNMIPDGLKEILTEDKLALNQLIKLLNHDIIVVPNPYQAINKLP